MKRTKQHTTYETHFKHKLNMLDPGIAMCRLICALVALGIAFLLMPIKIIAYIAFGLAGLTDIVNISYARHWLSLPPRCTCARNLRSASGFYYHHGIHTSAPPEPCRDAAGDDRLLHRTGGRGGGISQRRAFCRAAQRKLRAIPGGVPADGAQFRGMPKMNGLHINRDIGLGLLQCALYLVKRPPTV